MSPTASSLEMEQNKIPDAKMEIKNTLEVHNNEDFLSDGADSDYEFHETQVTVDSSPDCENHVLSTSCIVHDIETGYKNEVMNDNDDESHNDNEDSHNNNDGSQFETFSCSEDCHSKLDLISLD